MKNQYEVSTKAKGVVSCFFVEAQSVNGAVKRARAIIQNETLVEGQEWGISYVDTNTLECKLIAEYCSRGRKVVLRKTAAF